MAKLHKDKENLVDLGGTYNKLVSFYNERKKLINIVTIVIVLGVGAYLYYSKMVVAPRQLKAQNELFKAQYFFQLDSLNLALNGNEDFMGFLDIIDQYGGTKAGNISRYCAAICFRDQGRFEEAVDMMKKFKTDDPILGPLAYGNIGDCYRELGDSENAVKYYEKAFQKDNNEFTAPIYMKKAALTYEEDLDNPQKALELYNRINKEFWGSIESQESLKYIARIKARTSN